MAKRKNETIEEYRIRHAREERERRQRLGDQHKLKMKEYYWKNPERQREIAKKSYDKYKEKKVEYKREYRKNNPEKTREIAMKSYYNNRELINSKRRKEKKNMRDKILESLGKKCNSCGTVEMLQLDHINGGGRWEMEYIFKGAEYNMYKYYSNNLDKAKDILQVLCRTCNLRKRGNNKEYGEEYNQRMDELYSKYRSV